MSIECESEMRFATAANVRMSTEREKNGRDLNTTTPTHMRMEKKTPNEM